MAIGDAFTPTGKYGYSCQTVLSMQVNEFLHPGTYFCWLSVEFNPSIGGNSSNPLWLYQTLSHAVRTGDINDAKVKQIRTALLEAVARDSSVAAVPSRVAAAIVSISNAPLELLRPQVLRIELARVAGRMMTGLQYREERQVKDLKRGEFDMVIE